MLSELFGEAACDESDGVGVESARDDTVDEEDDWARGNAY